MDAGLKVEKKELRSTPKEGEGWRLRTGYCVANRPRNQLASWPLGRDGQSAAEGAANNGMKQPNITWRLTLQLQGPVAALFICAQRQRGWGGQMLVGGLLPMEHSTRAIQETTWISPRCFSQTTTQGWIVSLVGAVANALRRVRSPWVRLRDTHVLFCRRRG